MQRILTDGMDLQPVLLKGGVLRVDFGAEWPEVLIRLEGTDVGGDEHRTVVETGALILREVEPTPEMFEWVATEGGEYLIGHVRVIVGDNPGDKALLVYESRILGDFLDEEELEISLHTTRFLASELGETLQARFGGKRWNEES